MLQSGKASGIEVVRRSLLMSVLNNFRRRPSSTKFFLSNHSERCEEYPQSRFERKLCMRSLSLELNRFEESRDVCDDTFR